MLTFEHYLLESVISSDKEYEIALLNHYKDKVFVNEILQSDIQSSAHFGKSILESSGNIIIKYIESDTHIIIQGMISKTGKLIRTDIPDMKNWLIKLEMGIELGKEVLTSINDFSKPFIEKLLKNNPSFSLEELDTHSNKFGSWKTVRINNT